MHRLITLTFQYYSSLLFNNVIYSLMVGTAAYAIVGRSSVGVLIFTKSIAFAAATGHYYYMYRQSYYYYRNAGITVNMLYLCSFVLDIAIFSILISLLTIWSSLI